MRTAIDGDALHVTLRTPPRPWRRVEILPDTPSTNRIAMAASGPWELVLADHQSQGRGRLDRVWAAPPGTALTFSVTVPPPAEPGWVPLVAGLAVADGVSDITGLRTRLKWPNDVLLAADGDRKVCGILCEARAGTPSAQPLVVVGIGLNVAQERDELPVPTATSLVLAGATEPDRARLLVAILDRLTERYAALAAGGAAAEEVRAAYRAACATVGTRVRLGGSDGTDLEALAVGVDADGALLVDSGSGVRAYAAGDVTHIRPAAGGAGLA